MDWLFEISRDGLSWAVIAREKTEKEANSWTDGFMLNNPAWYCRVRMDK